MSESQQQAARKCVSCGIKVSGMNAASFNCPECGTRVHRCAKCRKQSNLYECPDCGFRGP
ncbi:HVO_2753 family zinc finger protein [Haloferacaceae archaeon DSL9]